MVSENRRMPYWNSTFGFHFNLCVCSHGHLILHLPAKFCSNRTIGSARATRVVFENSKTYFIFGTAPVAPMGVRQLWLKTYEDSSSVHGM